MDETVLTSRRAWLRTPAGTVPVRLRLTGTELRLDAADDVLVVVPLGSVVTARLLRLPRAAIEVRTESDRVRFRCFAPAAVLGLIRSACPARPSSS